ncbi:F-box domain cyclin-like protein [Penicillium atrosanguineum]|uniref:F-box domain cyclin-like protein n=1 Tax=Penicillium atrosanguineum TaxID=1132637 RepID=UPI002392B23C|nr:F-box domain cyclin-like protein [Penicillium atrosanguineum]KAJ5297173.1 F-box domain cyclin-like protein [Penicillium atrosanguineum]
MDQIASGVRSHLIVVCCHAIYLGGPNRGRAENEWLIEPFQRGETDTFMRHAEAAVELLVNTPGALLVVSGGPTKRPRTELSEGQSYFNLVKDNKYFNMAHQIDIERIIVEPHATDSYQNVLFSLLEFRLCTGYYPDSVTVFTHKFKSMRFLEYHFPAIGLLPNLPAAVTEGSRDADVRGVDPPEHVTSQESLIKGEAVRGIGLWAKDLYGVGDELARKRKDRGWEPGIEGVFLNRGLGEVVEHLVCWNGGAGSEWFPRMQELPWFYGNKEHS